MEKDFNAIIIDKLKNTDKFFKEDSKIAWVQYESNGIKQTCMVESNQYIQRVYKFCKDTYKVQLTKNSYDFIINTLNMYAIFECEERSIYLRNAKTKNKLYHDLTNQKYEVVEISDQTWKITISNKVLFKRYNDQKPQCYPKKGGKIKKLFDYVNIKSDKLLFIVYLISCFIEDIQHPILILHGESGHGKSTVSKILKELIDPNRYDLLSMPKKEEDFFLNMERNWFIPFDNISKISEEMSDNLCKVVTGAAMTKRKLYTNNDIYIINVKRCLVINGIENCAWKEDLLNRALIYEVKKVMSNI